MKMKQIEKQIYQKPVAKVYEALVSCICVLSRNDEVDYGGIDEGSGAGQDEFE